MADFYTRKFHVRWGDMDFNAHMGNTAYLDMAADVRMMYFQEHGFSMREFEKKRIGPVVMRDELDSGAAIDWEIHPTGTGTGEKYYGGAGIVTAKTISASYDGLVEASFSVQVSGAITEATN